MGEAQTDFVLRTLHDILKDPDAAKKLEQDTGLNRERLEELGLRDKKSIPAADRGVRSKSNMASKRTPNPPPTYQG